MILYKARVCAIFSAAGFLKNLRSSGFQTVILTIENIEAILRPYLALKK